MWRGEVLPNPTGTGFYATVETTESDMTEDEARKVMSRALDKLNAADPAPASNGALTGKVKWYNATKGFGFICPDDGSRDVFIHASVVREAGLLGLVEEQVVAFTSAMGPKGPQATSIAG